MESLCYRFALLQIICGWEYPFCLPGNVSLSWPFLQLAVLLPGIFMCVSSSQICSRSLSVWQKSGCFRARDELGIFQTHVCLREVWAVNSSFDPTQLGSASRDWCCQFDSASFREIMNWPLSHSLEKASWWHGANSHKSFNLKGVTLKL